MEEMTKVYPDGTEAVSGLDLDVGDGEFMVLVGPSGCGKTTALRMVAGLEDITAGDLRIGGRVVNDLSPKDRDVAMVFQDYALYPHMSVYDNMGFALKLRKVDRAEIDRRVREAAEILDLSDLLKKKPKNLSGGQRQRVAMGRAIVRQPTAFLMDEPLSNLDAKLRVQMRAEVARLQRQLKVTTLYVTHDQVEAMTMGSRVAVMRKGLLQQVDRPQTLYDRPVNLFVAGFIGSPAMNLVQARLAESNGDHELEFGGRRLVLDRDVLGRRPELKGYVGRTVILGIRPEDMEDASLAPSVPEGRCISVSVDLREALGSQVLVHFDVEAPRVVTEDLVELAEDAGEGAARELEQAAGAAKTRFVAALDPRTEVEEGRRLDLFVDTSRLHFFDPETRLGIYG